MRLPRLTSPTAVLATLVMVATTDARADDGADPRVVTGARPAQPSPAPSAAAPDRYAAFPMVKPHDKHYLRATLETLGIVGVGLVDYLINTNARGGTLKAGDNRWDLRYDWPTFRDKLTGAGILFDGNRFGTNYAAHPFAGTLYYSAARTNHLSFGESVLFAFAGSTTWEYFGEIREVTSVNDLIVTPMAGAAIGEATLQLAGFFDRGEKRFTNDALSFLFSPLKTINEGTDDARTLRSTSTDSLGFTREVWHRFVVATSAGVTVQHDAGRDHPGGTYTDVRTSVDTSLANLPGFAGAAREAHLFDDGNVSNLHLSATFSRGAIVDSLFATRVVPLGYYYRDAIVDAAGRPAGQTALVGLRISFEYGMHDWDRDRGRATDVISVVSPVGLATEHAWSNGDWQVRTALDVFGSISGVTPYALSDYRLVRQDGLRGTPTPVRNRGYYHGLGISAVPAVDLAWRSLRLGARMRYDVFRTFEGLDENQALVDPALRIADRRTSAEASLSLVPRGTPVRLAVDARRASRLGDMGPVHASRSETSLLGSIGVVF